MMASEDHDPRREGAIWVLDGDEPVPNVTPLVEAVFRRAGAEHIPALADVMNTSPAEIAQRFASGRRCTAAWVDGQLAAYGWVSYEQEFIGELRLSLRLQPGEAYIWDCATRPVWRRHHLYSALLGVMLGELRRESIRRVWIGADLDNEASQRGIARAGFHHVADIIVSRVLAMRLAWVQGLPGVPEDLVADARRVFLDNRDQVWLTALSAAHG